MEKFRSAALFGREKPAKRDGKGRGKDDDRKGKDRAEQVEGGVPEEAVLGGGVAARPRDRRALSVLPASPFACQVLPALYICCVLRVFSSRALSLVYAESGERERDRARAHTLA